MSDINTYADEAAITDLTPINGDLVLNRDNNSLYLCTDSSASGIARWKKFTNDSVEAPFPNLWGAHFDNTWTSATGLSSYDLLYTGYTPAASNNLSISWWFKGTTTNVNRSLSPVMGHSNYGPFAPYLISAETASRSLNIAWNVNQTTASYSTGWGLGGTNSIDSIVDGDWHHLALVVSEVVGQNQTKAILYMDGSEFIAHTGAAGKMYTGPYTAHPWAGAYSEYVIGGLSNNISYVFGDYIDDVAFFESNITAEQVTYLYNGGKPGDVSSLDPKCWLRFGDHESDSPSSNGSIASVTDSSAYGNVVTTSASTQPKFLDLTGETIYA